MEGIGICYLYAQGDEKNVFTLTTTHLHLIHKGKPRRWKLEEIRGMEISHHRWIVGFIIGILITGLSILMFTFTQLSPYFLLMLLFVGIIATYVSWLGQDVLTLRLAEDRYLIYLTSVSGALKSFVGYFNAYLQGDHYFYIVISQEAWQEATRLQKLDPSALYALTTYPVHPKEDQLVFQIDPLRISGSITFREREGVRQPFLIPGSDLSGITSFSV